MENLFISDFNSDLLALVNFKKVEAKNLAKELKIPTLIVYRELFAIDKLKINLKVKFERMGKVYIIAEPNFHSNMQNAYLISNMLLKLKWLATKRNNNIAYALYTNLKQNAQIL